MMPGLPTCATPFLHIAPPDDRDGIANDWPPGGLRLGENRIQRLGNYPYRIKIIVPAMLWHSAQPISTNLPTRRLSPK